MNQTGSCWAFAIVATLEYKSKKEGKNLIFSEQSLVDCDTTNNGEMEKKGVFFYQILFPIDEIEKGAMVRQH
jgi:hypothetical protein